MLNLRLISKSFGEQRILDAITLGVMPGERIGLVGANGSGKTTLLKIIAGEMQADTGRRETGGRAIGYVPQQFAFGQESVEQVLISDAAETYRVDRVLEAVGLSPSLKSQRASSLSGGEQTRLGLATTLMADPAILLLDEPTNNLDTDGVHWLENYIRGFDGAVIVVSHDRTLLDNVATSIVALTQGKLQRYGGNYTFYREQKKIEEQSSLDEYQKNQDEKKRLRKSIVAQREKSQHAQSHTGQTDNDKVQRDFFKNRVASKHGQQAKAMEKRLARLDDVARPLERKAYHVHLDGVNPSSKLIVAAEQIHKRFGAQTIIEDCSLAIYGNERIWLSGANGSGKSTLLDILAGRTVPDAGTLTVGASVKIGYLSQTPRNLDEYPNGLSLLLASGADSETCHFQARRLGLTADLLYSPIPALSRGQVAKLCFAELLLQRNNLLILDEPTNHLDVETREEIEEALAEYKGALIVVSHDRYFVETIKVEREIRLP